MHGSRSSNVQKNRDHVLCLLAQEKYQTLPASHIVSPFEGVGPGAWLLAKGQISSKEQCMRITFRIMPIPNPHPFRATDSHKWATIGSSYMKIHDSM